jgi:phospholipase/carboxylesterase
MTEITNSYELPSQSGQTKSLVILLHGLGSNGQDLISLAPYWAKDLPDTVFVSPDAPFACDMVPPGYPNSYQWFSLQSRDPQTMLAGVKEAAPILEAFIKEQCEKYGVPPEKCALVGFSQGTMMSLYTAPHYNEELAGVLGFSGALLWGAETDDKALKKMPIRLIHGEADDVVAVDSYHMAREILEEAGYDVSGHTSAGLAHSIDEKGISAGGEFLKTVLNQ